jgi:hypothetical protein
MKYIIGPLILSATAVGIYVSYITQPHPCEYAVELLIEEARLATKKKEKTYADCVWESARRGRK